MDDLIIIRSVHGLTGSVNPNRTDVAADVPLVVVNCQSLTIRFVTKGFTAGLNENGNSVQCSTRRHYFSVSRLMLLTLELVTFLPNVTTVQPP